jgi:CyaY protein
MTTTAWDEADYRRKVQETLSQVERAFSDVDPDVAECEITFGALTVTLESGARFILSQQPSVRQIWLALAAQGQAHHFSYDSSKGLWFDDKGKGIELLAFVKKYFKESCGLDLAL